MLIYPDWPAPANVHAVSSSRLGGVSSTIYDSLNLGLHVNDNPELVAKNRLIYQQMAQMPAVPTWLNQVHGTHVAVLPLTSNKIISNKVTSQEPITADASFSQTRQQICTVMTADCLPLLICDSEGQQVAAVHAGWRGLCAGIIEKTIAHFSQPQQVLVWLGPAISQAKFEVGPEVRAQFMQHNSNAAQAFVLHRNGKYLADIYQLARQRLQALGVSAIYGGDYCTYQQAELFYSYRRDGQTGRMASAIWLD
ncbi:peptidoglycan editing factor PgeF [Rheinheimera sp. WS51]|uniref:peptidoglycan editing factor PgeF n=1 Tax=Rheinheimera sp. WS51 TaxID=3425886 RepID=UPI003D8EAE95